MTTQSKTALFAALLSFLAAGVSAQTMYTKVETGGRITVTDLPSMAAQPGTETVPAVEAPRAPARGIGIGIGSRRAAIIDAKEATRRLEQAQLKRQQGFAPLPGEQVQGAKAGVVNNRYWLRQEKLRQMVEQAQFRWSQTSQTQLARR